MNKFHILFFSTLLLGSLSSCKTTTVDPTDDASTIYVKQLATIKNYAKQAGQAITTTASGLSYYFTQSIPTAKKATLGEELEFGYTLYVLLPKSTTDTTIAATLVDTTYRTTSIYYPFFTGSLLPGLEEGLLLMREGEKASLLMPSLLAFGNVASTDGKIPANSPVRFDVTLKRSRSEAQQIADYISRNKLTVTDSTGGVYFILTRPGSTTALPTAGQTLTLNYSGKLLRAATGFVGGTGTDTKVVGVPKFVPGFEAGLARMHVGEKATVVFPSSLGYMATGAAQSGTYVIPPNSPLTFDLELVSAK